MLHPPSDSRLYASIGNLLRRGLALGRVLPVQKLQLMLQILLVLIVGVGQDAVDVLTLGHFLFGHNHYLFHFLF